MKIMKITKILSILLLFSLLFVSCAERKREETFSKPQTAREGAESAYAYLHTRIPSPGYGAEWYLIGASRGGFSVPDGYKESLSAVLKEKDGVLSARKLTENARVALCLSALGEDPHNFSGYDLLKPLSDTETVSRQGPAAEAYALLALTAADTSAEETDAYLGLLLSSQRPDGGWSVLTSDASPDPDVTAMVLCALAPYTEREEISSVVMGGIRALAAVQNEDGSFSSFGAPNAESCAQVLLALSVLPDGFTNDILETENVLSALLSFAAEDGGFAHIAGGLSSDMSTEQALCALSAYLAKQEGKPSFFSFSE